MPVEEKLPPLLKKILPHRKEELDYKQPNDLSLGGDSMIETEVIKPNRSEGRIQDCTAPEIIPVRTTMKNQEHALYWKPGKDINLKHPVYVNSLAAGG
jgi:hypothetical protein